MKIPALLTLLLAALLAALPTRRAQAEEVSFDVFYNSLADDGDWYNTPEFGYVWHPAIADGGDKWRPYTDGYWAETDDGWTWVSYESFGWAAYHYGRWTRLKDIGWAWVPGYQWGPGWVSWRTSDDYVGWAPLPPRADRAAGAVTVDYNDVEAADDGYTPAVDQDYDIGPDNYCFVETRRFGAPVLSEVILPPVQNLIFVERTVNVTNIYYRRGPERTVVYNNGPNFAFISGRVERPIQRLRIERRDDVAYLRDSSRGGGNPTVVRNGVLQVAAPVIARRPVNFEQVKPVRVKQTITETKVVHGWTAAGGDPAQVQRLREHIKAEAQAAPRQARADLPPQNVGPAPEPVGRPAANPPAAPAEDTERNARREAAQRERAARAQARANNQNAAQPAQDAQAAQDRAARKARQAQPAAPNDPTRENREVERLLQQQETQQAKQAQQAQRAQQAQQAQQPDREARRAERQQQQQPQPDREARRAERQQQQQQQPAAQPQAPAQPDREARRAERQQQQQPQPDREARRAERQQQAQQAQAPQERAERRAERQQQPQPQQGSDDDKKKKHDN